MGVLPTELLPRNAAASPQRAVQAGDARARGPFAVAEAVPEYRQLFAQHLDGEVAPARAPVPESPVARADNLKASAYFLDATLAGAARIRQRPGPRNALGDI